MSGWAVFAIVIGVLLVAAAAGVGGWYGWQALERRVLLRLLVRAEAIEAAAQALDDAVERLADSDDEELSRFANDPDSSERRALHEVAGRAELLREELDHMPLPKAVVPVAESLADAAYMTAREAGCVTDEDLGANALEKLASLDLGSVRAYVSQARVRLNSMCADFGLEDTAVYGGGLYL